MCKKYNCSEDILTKNRIEPDAFVVKVRERDENAETKGKSTAKCIKIELSSVN